MGSPDRNRDVAAAPAGASRPAEPTDAGGATRQPIGASGPPMGPAGGGVGGAAVVGGRAVCLLPMAPRGLPAGWPTVRMFVDAGRRAHRQHRREDGNRCRDPDVQAARRGEQWIEVNRAARAARVDKMPPRRGTSLVPLQRACRRSTLRAARGEAIPARRRGFRVPTLLRLGLPKSAGDPAPSRHQPSAKAQDAPWWERQSPRTVSQKTARDAPVDLLPIICEGDGGAGALARAGDQRYPPALSGVSRAKRKGARPESWACSAAKSAKDEGKEREVKKAPASTGATDLSAKRAVRFTRNEPSLSPFEPTPGRALSDQRRALPRLRRPRCPDSPAVRERARASCR
jgi:hypothetical protein